MVQLDEVKSVAILGDIHSCKTNLAFHLLREYKKQGGKRQIYLVGYPKQVDDFKVISFFNDLFKLSDSILFIDEIQKYINIYDRRRVQEFVELISFFAHNNNTLIFTTCLSHFIPKRLEPYLDCLLLTKIMDVKGLKNGGKPKRIIDNTTNPKCNQWSLSLLKGEYLEHSDLNESEDNGIKTFPNQGIGKDWRIKPPEMIINSQQIQNSKDGTHPKSEEVSIQRIGELKSNRRDTLFGEDKTADISINQNTEKETFPQETKVSKLATKDLTDKEIRALAWGGSKPKPL